MHTYQTLRRGKILLPNDLLEAALSSKKRPEIKKALAVLAEDLVDRGLNTNSKKNAANLFDVAAFVLANLRRY